MKEIVRQLISEFNEYFDSTCEYGIGYLDALTEVCQRLDIPHVRTENDLYLKEVV